MYFFIVNLTSRTGKAREIWIQVERELHRRSVAYEAYFTEYEGHAKKLAMELCTRALQEEGENCLVVVGGDGTANEVVNGMHHFDKVQFGYIATGSGNDLGRGLGISREPLEALARILEADTVFPMDLGRVTDGEGRTSYFTISSGIGIDAEVCRQALTSRLKKVLNHLGLGSLTYVLLTIRALFTMPTTQVTVSFDGKLPKKIDKMIFVAGMNHPWEGGGVPMAPKADCQDGRLSVCCVYGIPRWKAFFLLPILVMGKHEGIRGFEIVDCEKFELTLEQPMVVHGDGEYLGEQVHIRYQCVPGLLQVRK